MPHYDRHTVSSSEQNQFAPALSNALDDAAAENAAGALREIEVEAVQSGPDVRSLTSSDIQQMNIDELRVLAKQLDIPDRGTILERDELLTEILKHI